MKLEQLPELWELWSRLVSHCLPSLCLVGATEDRNRGSGSFGRTAAIQPLSGCAVRSEDTWKQCSHISINLNIGQDTRAGKHIYHIIYSNNTQSVLSGRLLVSG